AIGGSLVNSIEGTSDATSSIGNDKVVLDARDDAASFVASGGETRGVQLEAALQHIREQLPELPATDMQLAEGHLALCAKFPAIRARRPFLSSSAFFSSSAFRPAPICGWGL